MDIPSPNDPLVTATATAFADKVANELATRIHPKSGVSPSVSPQTPDGEIDDVITDLEAKGWSATLSSSHADHAETGRKRWRTLIILPK